MLVRRPCVAGQFYPEAAKALEGSVKGFVGAGRPGSKEKAVAIIVPHAGYVYSGGVAGSVYSSVVIPDDVILLGPNHTGLGRSAAVMTEGEWATPLGKVRINTGLAQSLVESCPLFSADTLAHAREHSLEVQLPFLRFLNKGASIVPVTIMRAGLEECMEMGKAVAKTVSDAKKDILIIVSSDMNHYESDAMTREKDRLAIEKVLSLDAKGLLDVTSSRHITMCGVIPAATALFAAKGLGAKGARLVKYATSGEQSGDYDRVVGYAGFVID